MREKKTSYKIITQPVTEPMLLTYVKNFLKLDGISADDDLVSALLTAARQRCEEYCNIKFIDTVIEQVYDEFPKGRTLENCLHLTIGNVSSVEFVKYYVDLYDKAGRICVTTGKSYPSSDTDRINNVVVRYTSGFGVNATDVPEAIKHAILLQVGYMYNNREDKVKSMSTLSEYLLQPYKTNFI
jgi:hypothetical protein